VKSKFSRWRTNEFCVAHEKNLNALRNIARLANVARKTEVVAEVAGLGIQKLAVQRTQFVRQYVNQTRESLARTGFNHRPANQDIH